MAKSKKEKMLAPKVEQSSPQPANPTEYDDYKVKDAYDTLLRGQEHMGDKKLMKHVHAHAKKRRKAIRGVDDLIKYRNDFHGSKKMKDLDAEDME